MPPTSPGAVASPVAGGWGRPAVPAARSSTLPVLLAHGLLALFLVYVFIGTTPLDAGSAEGRAEGGSLDRLAVLGLTGLSVLLLASRSRSALAALKRTGPVWLMVAVILGSVLWSAFPDITLRRASATALVALVCFAIAASGLPLSRIHGALVAVLGVAVAGALLVTALRPDFAVTPIGIRGFYQHKNVLGMVAFIATVVVACRLCALGPGRLVARLAHAAVLAGGLILLVLSQSKTSLAIAAGLVAAIPLFVAMRRLRGGRAGLWLLVLALFGLAGATLVAGLPSRSLMTLVASDVDLTFTGRDEIWNFVLSEVAQRPWTGFGYGAYWDVTPEADPVTRAPPDGWLRQARVGIINQAHNGYLDVAVQLGLPGLALAVGLLLWSFWRALALFMRPETPSGERWAALTIVLLFAGITIHNLSETSLWARGQILANLTLLLMFLAAAAPGAAAARPDRPGRWGRG